MVSQHLLGERTVPLVAAREVAQGELARLRDEASLRSTVPALMSRALGLEAPVFALEREHALDRDVHEEAARAFAEKSSRFASVEGGGVWLAAPVRYEGEVAGVIAGRRGLSLETDERDLARLDAFAAIVGMTLENVRLYEDLQR